MHRAIDEKFHNGIYSVVVATECYSCHGKKMLTIPESEWIAWNNGGLIQNVMPSVGEQDRELLISGTCGTCFDSMFSDEALEADDALDAEAF